MKVLYFVRGGIPTPAQAKEIKALNAIVRNAKVHPSDFIEHCDAVAGDVPEPYRKYPTYPIEKGKETPAAASSVAKQELQPEAQVEQPQPEEKKPLEQMNKQELIATAHNLGISFPDGMTKHKDMADYIARDIESRQQVGESQ